MGDRVFVWVAAAAAAMTATGCGTAEDSQNDEVAVGARPIDLTLTKMQNEGVRYVADVTKNQQATAAALVRVKKVMEKYLFDPTTARYTAIQIGRDGSVCGQYNAKNRYNAYVGFKDFVLTGDGELFASDSNGGLEASMSPSYIRAYLDSCATKAQIAAHRSAMESYSYESDGDGSPVSDQGPLEQEPDSVLDAPPARARPQEADIPTA